MGAWVLKPLLWVHVSRAAVRDGHRGTHATSSPPVRQRACTWVIVHADYGGGLSCAVTTCQLLVLVSSKMCAFFMFFSVPICLYGGLFFLFHDEVSAS